MHPHEHKMRTAEAANYLGVSASFLEKRRVAGDGPRFSKFGRVVRYSKEDLDHFADINKRSSTSEDK